MKKFISTFFLSHLVFLSTLSNTININAAEKGIFNQIDEINQNANNGDTYNYKVTGNEIISNTNLSQVSSKTFWPVQKAVNWNITGNKANENIQGTVGIYNTATSNVSGKLTLKNIGSVKTGTDIKNASLSDVNGAVKNLTSHLNNNNKEASETPAVYVINSNLDVDNVVFAGSSNGNLSNSSEAGAAIHVRKVQTMQITDANGNKKTVTVSGTPVANISNSKFIENKTNDNGAAINVDKVQLNVSNSQFVKNTANEHAGAIDVGGNTVFENNKFYKNSANDLGGAVFVHDYSTLTSNNNIFEGNKVSVQNGGAVENIGKLKINGDTFTQNSANGATSSGGAVSNDFITRRDASGNIIGTYRGTAEIKNATFNNNFAKNSGGAVYNVGTMTSQNSTYKGNKAAGGGAVSNDTPTNQTTSKFTSTNDVYTDNTATSVGGAIYNTAEATFDGATFTKNSATQGGAIYNTGIVTLNNAYKTKFYDNNATGVGSAVYNTGTFTINNASDTIDLDYNPHTNVAYPTKQVRLFADKEDIYNSGIINVNNSDLQLHYDSDLTKGFINVHDSLTNRKTGTINVRNSRIDIGKTILYGDAINLYDGSELLTHINAIATNDFGKIQANNIYVSPNDTDITIIVEAGTHLKEGESKVFHILDASKQLNAVAPNGFQNITENKMYDIKYLGDGKYQLSRPGKEPEESDPSDPSDSDDSDNSDPSDPSDPSDSDDSDNSDPSDPSDPSDSDDSDNSDPSDPSDPSDSDDSDNSDPSDPSDPSDSDDSDNSDPSDPSDPSDSDKPDEPITPNPDDSDDKDDDKICPEAGCIHNAWVEEGKMIGNETAIRVQNVLNEMAQRLGCDSKEYQDALDGIAPDVSPLIQAHSTEITRRLAATVSKHMSVSMERTAYKHRGKRFYHFPRRQANLWVEGLYGKSEYDAEKGFDMDNKGLAVGFDKHVSDNTRMGIAYAYTMSEGESVGRDTEVDSHTIMVYGEYNPNRFYTNWLALYTRSNYEEEKKVFHERVNAEYDVDVFAAQIMMGKKTGPFVFGDWATGVISPELGLRYTYLNQHDYTDQAGQDVKGGNGHVLTGILGAQYVIGYAISPTLAWYPEFRAAITYDFITPDMENSVTLVNGSRYKVVTENLDRFGVEIGARVGLDINKKTEVAVEYEGIFKGDYTNHTGLASLKYKF